jgi:hypothetical protein
MVSGARAAIKTLISLLLSRGEPKGEVMPRTNPWHSVKEPRYHNNTNCNSGNNIERENLRWGTGNKVLCRECAYLNSRGR